MLLTMHQLPFVAIIWGYFHYRNKVGVFVHQWDLRAAAMVDVGLVSLRHPPFPFFLY